MASDHTLRIGGHLSSSGGHLRLFERAREMGMNCFQMFSTSPRVWRPTEVSDTEAEAFRTLQAQFDIAPVYFHASYLVNLADPDMVGMRSRESLIHELRLAARMGVRGSIIHLGSFKGNTPDYDILYSNIQHILAETPKETLFIIENAGNRKIGLTLDELGFITKHVAHRRVRVCLDTCHLYSAGYDLGSTEKLGSFLTEFDAQVGLDRLEVWHINDSRDPFASFRDRHDNLGAGTMGDGTFRALANHPMMSQLPFILEVPGYDDKGPDKKNVDTLKSFIV